MATTFDTGFVGAADTVLTTGFACDVGSIAFLADIIPGSVLELNGSGFLRLDTAGTVGRGFAMTGTSTVNGTVTVYAKTGGAGASSVILHTFRIASAGNYYALVVNQGTGGVRIDRYDSGAYAATVCSHATDYAATTDYDIRATYNGTAFTLYRDGLEVASGTDSTHTTSAFAQELYLYNESNATPTILGRVRISDTVDVPVTSAAPPFEWDVVARIGEATTAQLDAVLAWQTDLQWRGGIPAAITLAAPPPRDDGALASIASAIDAALWLAIEGPLDTPSETAAGGFGSATGAVVFTGSATGALRVQGSAAGAAVFTGSATGTLRNQGSASGAVVFRGSATGALRIAGSSSGAVVFTGSATGQQNAGNSGSAAGAVVFTGSASGVLRNDGSAAGSALFTGSAFGTLRVQGVAGGAVVFTGLASGTLRNQGSASGAVVFTGSASGTQGAPGNGGAASGAVVFTGAASGALRLSGSASGVVVFRGNAGGIDPNPNGASSGRMRRAGVRTPYQFTQ